MKKRIKTILLLGVIAIMGLGIFAGCGSNIHCRAVLFDNTSEWARTDFLRENLTRGTFQFHNGYEWEEVADANELPQCRTFIITDEVKFNEIFLQFPPGINFESEILIVHIISNSYLTRPYRLRNLEIINGKVHISVQLQRPRGAVGGAAELQQRVFAVRMDRHPVSEVNFTVRNH